jgi:hypothetical protein
MIENGEILRRCAPQDDRVVCVFLRMTNGIASPAANYDISNQFLY